MEENYTIKTSPENIKCVNCIYAAGNPFKTFCIKYKNKPLGVLYDGTNCPKFEEEIDEDEEGDIK